MKEIIWTKTDEAPLLASYSLLPMLKVILKKAGVNLRELDISLASRILAVNNIVSDDLAILSDLVKKSDTNIIKLPNISASLPQLKSAFNELKKYFDLGEFDLNKYSNVLGSAVNPILRQGNSDRRSVKAVKDYAKSNPHKLGDWNKNIKTKVKSMKNGDFYENEKSILLNKDDVLCINFKPNNSHSRIIKDNIEVFVGDIFDISFLSSRKLDSFIDDCILEAKKENLLFSVHLKATMMKISDPEIFGHFVKRYFRELFEEFKDELKDINPNNGLKEMLLKIEQKDNKDKILDKINEIYSKNPSLAMVNSESGITNLHVPSDIIVDASMPAMLVRSGRMWDKDGNLSECLAVLPDKTYSVIYQACIDNFKEFGKLDVSKIGSLSNIGLMANKAQEYGSHDKSFVLEDDGIVEVLNSNGEILLSIECEKGDIFRGTYTSDKAIDNWIDLAFRNSDRAQPVFWLDENRSHDNILISKIKTKARQDIEFKILKPYDACIYSLNLIRQGKDTMSVTGNVLRDYLTDLFPILELGTSAKMLSVVPLLNGGGLFETGAGGTAPMIVKRLKSQNRFTWDSLGEYLALLACLEHLNNPLSSSLNLAINRYLNENRSPKPDFDARLSQFYFIYYWLQELKSDKFKNLKDSVNKHFDDILKELKCESKEIDIDENYYFSDEEKIKNIMRPSKILNSIFDKENL